jgi:hypothetical protein
MVFADVMKLKILRCGKYSAISGVRPKCYYTYPYKREAKGDIVRAQQKRQCDNNRNWSDGAAS